MVPRARHRHHHRHLLRGPAGGAVRADRARVRQPGGCAHGGCAAGGGDIHAQGDRPRRRHRVRAARRGPDGQRRRHHAGERRVVGRREQHLRQGRPGRSLRLAPLRRPRRDVHQRHLLRGRAGLFRRRRATRRRRQQHRHRRGAPGAQRLPHHRRLGRPRLQRHVPARVGGGRGGQRPEGRRATRDLLRGRRADAAAPQLHREPGRDEHGRVHGGAGQPAALAGDGDRVSDRLGPGGGRGRDARVRASQLGDAAAGAAARAGRLVRRGRPQHVRAAPRPLSRHVLRPGQPVDDGRGGGGQRRRRRGGARGQAHAGDGGGGRDRLPDPHQHAPVQARARAAGRAGHRLVRLRGGRRRLRAA
mmetsp:Transcript_5105/g.18372  ORF Transcript_5105/g.18372 Transcript_5105/m.18372 type:complete len:360 (-) Transcript_5105:638-1717(-)